MKNLTQIIITELKKEWKINSSDIYDGNYICIEIESCSIEFNINITVATNFQETKYQPEELKITNLEINNLEIFTKNSDIVNLEKIKVEILNLLNKIID